MDDYKIIEHYTIHMPEKCEQTLIMALHQPKEITKELLRL